MREIFIKRLMTIILEGRTFSLKNRYIHAGKKIGSSVCELKNASFLICLSGGDGLVAEVYTN